MKTLRTLFTAVVDRDPTRPLLTYYHDGTGERTELSAATLANWVAKTANLLVDGLGLAGGDHAVVRLPPHWQTAAVLLGCWSVGLDVHDDPGTPADVAFADSAHTENVTVGDRYLVSLHPFGLPLPSTPAGWLDYGTEVRGYGDHFTGEGAATAEHDRLLQQAGDQASSRGMTDGDRILIDADRYPDPVDWLLAPLCAGASIVLCAAADPGRLADRERSERVTRVLA